MSILDNQHMIDVVETIKWTYPYVTALNLSPNSILDTQLREAVIGSINLPRATIDDNAHVSLILRAEYLVTVRKDCITAWKQEREKPYAISQFATNTEKCTKVKTISQNVHLIAHGKYSLLHNFKITHSSTITRFG